MGPDGDRRLRAGARAKGDARCQVQVQHSKLKNARDVERKKAYWGEQLDRLKELLES